MSYEEYQGRIKELDLDYKKRKNRIAIEYALSNKKYSVGDIVSDHIRTIKVESVRVTYRFPTNEPGVVYEGVWLLKSGEPNKRNETHSISDTNIKES